MVKYLLLILLTPPLFAEFTPATRAMPLLERYCRACHGFGERRFLYEEAYSDNWDRLLSTRTRSGELWIDAIYKSINWPSHAVPETKDKMPSGKSWMPKGSKRYDIAEETVDGMSAREALLNALQWAVETP